MKKALARRGHRSSSLKVASAFELTRPCAQIDEEWTQCRILFARKERCIVYCFNALRRTMLSLSNFVNRLEMF